MTDERNIPSRKVSPVAWVPTLYFAMGMPFVVLNMVCTLMYKGMGGERRADSLLDLAHHAAVDAETSVESVPEMYKTKKFFVVLTQLVSGIGFALVAFALHLPDFFAITIAIPWVIALSGATHDIAADGTYMSVLSKEEQAKWIGWQGAFYNIAKIAATGGLVYLAGVFIKHFGVTTALDGDHAHHCRHHVRPRPLPHLHPPRHVQCHQRGGQKPREALRELWNIFADFFKKKHIVYYLFFIILYRFCEGFVMKIVPLFLKAPRTEQGLGLSEQEIGLCYGTFGQQPSSSEASLRGYYIAHRGLQKSLFQLAPVFNLPFVAYTFLAIYQPTSVVLIGSAITLEYFGYGFGFVGLTLFMMQQIAPGKHQMSHYAFASGIMNLGVMLPQDAQRLPQRRPSYRTFFLVVLLCAIPALLITLVRAVHLS